MVQENIAKKRVLITGGGSGIGRAAAQLFLDAGCLVVITGRTESRLVDTAAALGQPERLFYNTCDVANQEEVQTLIDWAVQQLGGIDILVNNAGRNLKQRAFLELTPQTWKEIIDTNLNGAYYCMQAVVPHMLKQQDGLIINICSIAGKRSSPLGGVAYAASKFGMHALNHGAGSQLQEHGIRCTCIYPGEVDTSILDDRPQPVSDEHRQRILKAEDVAEAILFVARMPTRVSIPEMIIKPATQTYI